MSEKSKAFELIEFVWNNEKTDSHSMLNTIMRRAVGLAITSQMKFDKDDFKTIYTKFRGGHWFGVNENGKGIGENFYSEAVGSGNISACKSYESFYSFKPFIDAKGRRLRRMMTYFGDERRYRVTGFDFDTKKVHLVSYEMDDIHEEGQKTLFNFTNKEWNEFRKKLR